MSLAVIARSPCYASLASVPNGIDVRVVNEGVVRDVHVQHGNRAGHADEAAGAAHDGPLHVLVADGS